MKRLFSATLVFLMISTLMVSANMASDELPVDGWKVYVSSQNAPGGTPREAGERVLDGNVALHWHSSIEPKAEGPHYLTVELPEITEMSGYRYYPKLGAGTCKKYEIYLSVDNENFQLVARGSWAYDESAKTADFGKNYKAKFVRLQFVEGHLGYASAGEIRVLRAVAGNPAEELTPNIKESEIGTAVSDNQSVASQGAANAGNAMSLDYISKEKVSGEALYDDELAPKDWLFQVSSVNSPDGTPRQKPENVVDGDLQTHWHSAIEPKAKGPHYFTIILPEETTFSGWRYYPRKGNPAGICLQYEVYISNDNENFEKIASGKWDNNEDAKTAEFSKNYKAKYVRLQYVAGAADYGTAGEMRLLAPVAEKETAAVTNANVKRGDIAATQVGNKGGLLKEDEISVKGWTFDTSSTNTDNGVPRQVPERTIDGDLQSHWHSMVNPKAAAPHYITIILPEEQVVSGYRYYPRADGGAGICTKFEIHVSHNGKDFQKVVNGTWIMNTSAKSVNFATNIKVKAVKLVILEGRDGYGTAGELRLLKEDPERKTITAKDLVENPDKYSMVDTIFHGTWIMTDKAEEYSSELMIDGNNQTYYHSGINPTKIKTPITIDMGFSYPYTISGFTYQPRTDGNLSGHFEKVQVEYSLDGVNFESSGEYTIKSEDDTLKTIIFNEAVKAKFIRIKVVKAKGNYASCGELHFLQTEGDYKKDSVMDDKIFVLKIDSKDIIATKEGKTETITTDAAPFIFKNYTMIPLRGLLEQMGASVNWVAYDQKIEVFTENNDYMLFQIENDRVYINDVRFNAQVAPIIKDGRTYIPLRFVSEHLGYNVGWDGETRTITISTK